MSAIALPATSTTPALTGEAELVRAATRGDETAFEELYRRHNQSAWRLAVAVSPDAAHAAGAVAYGFSRSLRSAGRRSGSDVRAQVLAGVYRAALEQARSGSGADVPAGAGPVEAAFLGLPERWRGALWLSEVEGFDPTRAGAVLTVSPATARQLAVRGRQGLADRLGPSGVELPADLGATLVAMAAVVPASLPDLVGRHWHAGAHVSPLARINPVGAALGERTMRTLGVAVGSLLALGVIGIGVLGQSSLAPSNAPLTSAASSNPNRSLGVAPHHAATHLAPPSSGVVVDPAKVVISGGVGSGLALTSTVSHLRTSGGAGVTVVTAPPSGGHHGTGGSSRGTTGGNPPTGGGQGTSGGTTGAGGGTTPTTAGPTPVVDVPGVLSVGTGDGSTSATVLPGSGTSPAGVSVTVCPDGLSLSALGISVLSECPTGSAPPGTGAGTSNTGESAGGATGTAPATTPTTAPANSGSAGSTAPPAAAPTTTPTTAPSNPLTKLLGSLGL